MTTCEERGETGRISPLRNYAGLVSGASEGFWTVFWELVSHPLPAILLSAPPMRLDTLLRANSPTEKPATRLRYRGAFFEIRYSGAVFCPLRSFDLVNNFILQFPVLCRSGFDSLRRALEFCVPFGSGAQSVIPGIESPGDPAPTQEEPVKQSPRMLWLAFSAIVSIRAISGIGSSIRKCAWTTRLCGCSTLVAERRLPRRSCTSALRRSASSRR